jgi:hypothetical protein
VAYTISRTLYTPSEESLQWRRHQVTGIRLQGFVAQPELATRIGIWCRTWRAAKPARRIGKFNLMPVT